MKRARLWLAISVLAVGIVLTGVLVALPLAMAAPSWEPTTALWTRVAFTDPALVGSVADRALKARRATHRQVLDLLANEQLSGRGRFEAYRLLGILRPADRRTIELLWAQRADRLEADETSAMLNRVDPFDVRAAEAALGEIGLPAVPYLLREREAKDEEPGGPSVIAGPQWIAGPAALPMAEEAWRAKCGPDEAKRLTRGVASAVMAPPYELRSRAKPNEAAQGDLVDLLNSEDPAVRLAPAARLIRQLREAEQWLAEALAVEDSNILHDLRERPPDAPVSYVVTQWPAGQEPPTQLSEQGRFECIQALGELRPLTPRVIDALLLNIGFVPETWPYRVSPAAVAAAKTGLPVRWRIQCMGLHASREKRNKLLDALGVMLGRFAAEPMKWEARERGSYPELEADIEYLETTYAGTKALHEVIPEAPPEG